jgi:protein-tyrosine phosphatase
MFNFNLAEAVPGTEYVEEHHMVDSHICYVKLLHQVASFPFDDHNCPPTQLIISFCQSAYLWLKEDIENVVVVHCKAGMARTGLMISSLLLYLKVRNFKCS